jgi:membrane-associated phospholipid phosphatase
MGGGAVATLAKMFVLRPRPNSLNLDVVTYDYAWIWSFDWTLSHVATYDASTRAFPSAYLATATALTVGLWVVLPRGRWLFAALCAGTMFQRLYCGAHFTSDLFGSTAVGLGWAYVCYHPSLMGNLFDKMEPERTPRRSRWEDQELNEDIVEEVPSKRAA